MVRTLTAKDLLDDPSVGGPEFDQIRSLASIFAGMQDMWDMPMAIKLDHIPNGHRMGAGIRITSGEAAGRQLYCLNGVGNVFLCVAGARPATVGSAAWWRATRCTSTTAPSSPTATTTVTI